MADQTREIRDDEHVVVLQEGRAQCPACGSWNTEVNWVDVATVADPWPVNILGSVECLDCHGVSA